ncbi:ACT domain-containing protein ACR12 isoform X1 [Musa acuminata AAA Group]|uniref:ACT domain-containing protein ACR12 isoform X1 n=1 Tax=Musa acuminata AAA Group TaxID=214697 RepID=UPI0031DFA31B
MALASAFLSSRFLFFSPAALRPRSRVSAHLEFPQPLEIGKHDPSLHGSVASGGGVFLGKLHGDSHDSQYFLNPNGAVETSSKKSDQENDSVPMPIILIDQDSDAHATIVWLSFGDRLGALLDTMRELKDLGLDVTKGTVTTEDAIVKTQFFITQQGCKVEDPEILERIRLSIIDNLLKYHPESSERLAMGEVFGNKPPKKLDVDDTTHVLLQDDGPKRSLLYIETADRPGLLLEIIKIILDISIDVESAEIDTEGLVAKDIFHVSYRGAALSNTLSQVLINSLLYYLRRPGTEEDSY